MVLSEQNVNTDIAVANRFVKRSYLSNLTEYEVIPLPEHQKRFQSIRLYKINKLIYDSSEDVNDKLVSVFNSVQNTRSNLVLMLCGKKNAVDFYIGVQSMYEIGIADKVFQKSMLGNFPGSSVQRVSQSEVSELLSAATDYEEGTGNLTCLNVVPAIRNENDFVQGMEKFIDTMRGEDYVCMLLASSISDSECEQRLRGYEQLYTTLYPLSNMSLSHGTSEGTTFTEGYTRSISNSVSDSIAKTTGQSESSTGTNGFSIGLLGMGYNHSRGKTTGTTTSDTQSTSTSKQESEGTSASQSKSQTLTDNYTVAYKDKMIEDTLENIDHRIGRIKECMSFGMWECAAYFMSGDLQTSVVAANAFRSLMLGEDNKNEKTFLNLFGKRENISTTRALETLKYCRHPMFKLDDLDIPTQVTATEYLSGKEVPLLFALPRKSVAGVAVTSMAEFGRNVVYVNEGMKPDAKMLNIGRVSHMNQIEDSEVKLNLQSLSAHCFVTGSTGSGKSNTTFTLLGELLKPEINIPFLVVEPAKGEYKYAFTNVPGINIFTTSTSTGRFLKLNPFRFQKDIHVLEHLDRLIEIFNTCWEMYAAMPAILKDAIERIYEKKGWDLLNSVYMPGGEPQYPTFKDLLTELPEIINQSGYSSDTKGDYIGALVTRVNSLTNGIVGQIFCDCYDIEDEVLFDQSAIVDLSRVGSSETKSLIMGILVLKLTEYRMATIKATNSPLRHVTVLEEAHNLLKNVRNNPGSASAVVGKSVEMICNSIAEMRTYGESFILVDQSPGAVDIAAIKNTNTKIIMRLPEMGDCEAIGRSVSLNEKQILELSKLKTGSAVVMQNNWCDAVLTQINRHEYPYEGEIPTCDGAALLRFKSAVLGSLLDEYAIHRTRSIENVFETIDAYDIDDYKKEDARCMVRAITASLDRKWDSLFFGKAIMQYVGLDIVFRRAENTVKGLPLHGKEKTDAEQSSTDALFRFLNDEISRMISVNDRQRRIIIQYIVYIKAYEKTSIDYDWIYKTKYIR